MTGLAGRHRHEREVIRRSRAAGQVCPCAGATGATIGGQVSDSSWRYPEQRHADPPSAHRERRGASAPAGETFAGLYHAPASGAVPPGPRRLPDGSGRREGPGGHRRRDDRAAGDRAARFGDDVPVRAHGWGTLPGSYGVLIMAASAAVGAFATMLARAEPGTALGAVLVAGALAGTFAVHPRVAYRLIPVPAIVGFAAALLAGVVHDRAVDTSRTVLALNALGWMAGGFAAMAAATAATLVIVLVRYVRDARRRRSGGFAEAPSDDHR